MIDMIDMTLKSDTPVLRKSRLMPDSGTQSFEMDWLHNQTVQENNALRQIPESNLSWMDKLLSEWIPIPTQDTGGYKPIPVIDPITPLPVLPLLESSPVHLADISEIETTRQQITSARTSEAMPRINVLSYRSATLLKHPLLAIEGAIMNHVEKRGKTPISIYLSSLNKPALYTAHMRVKHSAFQDVYYYFDGIRIEAVQVYYEAEMNAQLNAALNGHIDADVIYTDL